MGDRVEGMSTGTKIILVVAVIAIAIWAYKKYKK
jgi:hypothetical protein